jgi:hypothetical protein
LRPSNLKSTKMFKKLFILLMKPLFLNPLCFTGVRNSKGTKSKLWEHLLNRQTWKAVGKDLLLLSQAFHKVSFKLFLAGKQKQCWGIKVKKFVGWVGLGICLRNVIKKSNYHFNYTNTGHGSYLISSNGYSWSHSVKELNSAFKTFQFSVNDTVYVEYDPTTWKLRFRKNQGP